MEASQLIIICLLAVLILLYSTDAYNKWAAGEKAKCKQETYAEKKPVETFQPATNVLAPGYDHNDHMIDQSLGKEAIESHKQYIEEAGPYLIQTSALDVDIDHRLDPVNWLGLRRPDYNVPEGADARQVSGIFKEQLPQSKPFIL